MILLPENLFINLIDAKLQQCIRDAKDLDPHVDTILQALAQKTSTTLLPDLLDWKMEQIAGDHILYYKDRLYIPKDHTL